MSEKIDTRRSVALAEIRDTDSDEFKMCVTDMKRHAGVDDKTAKLIATAFRAKSLPNVAHAMGLSDQDISGLLKRGGDLEETETDFATDDGAEDIVDEEETDLISDDEVEDDEEYVDTEEVSPEDIGDDNEEMPEGIAHVTMELPVEMLPDLKEALRSVIGDEVDTMFPDETGAASEDEAISEEITPELEEGEPIPMTKQEIAARKAAREAILTKVAQTPEPKDIGLGRDNIKQDAASRTPENKTTRVQPKDIGLGSDTSFGGKPYVFSDESQHHDEVEYPTLTMKNSEGNSLKEQNPTYNPVMVYTTNPDLLQLKDSYDEKKFTETPVNTLTLDAELGNIKPIPSNVPSSKDGPYDASKTDKWEVPTQMADQLPKHNTTTQMVTTASRECMGCYNPSKKDVNYVECSDCRAQIAICEECEEEGYCPSCAATLEKSASNVGKIDLPLAVDIEPTSGLDKMFTRPEEDDEEFDIDDIVEDDDDDEVECKPSYRSKVLSDAKKAVELYKARAKTAYKYSAVLAANGVIDVDEIDQIVLPWLDSGLTVEAMRTQATLMLRTSQTSSQRVAAAANMERTASRQAISFNPSVPTNQFDNSVTDMKKALDGMKWSTPETQYASK